jgi:tRNA pseudouridine55 synthase
MSKSGWLIIDKPLDLTSTRVGSIVRRTLGLEKIGHIGTLDPLATGVLTLALGEATKAIPYYNILHKTYDFEVTWGESRSTDDREGEILETSLVRPTLEKIQSLLPKFVGKIEQVPPVFSAIKISGRRSYEMARSGHPVISVPRNVVIHSLEVVKWLNIDQCQFRVVCGSGTYVRSLGRDMAIALGTVGYISELRRIQDGKFSVKDAISLEKLKEIAHKEGVYQCIKPIRAVLDDIPAVAVSASDIEKLRLGQRIKSHSSFDQNLVAIYDHDRLVAIATFQDGYWQPKRVFHCK